MKVAIEVSNTCSQPLDGTTTKASRDTTTTPRMITSPTPQVTTTKATKNVTRTGKTAAPKTIDWKFGVKNEECVSPSSSVIFKWSGFHNVAKVANEDDFTNCANGVVKSTDNAGPYTWQAPATEGTHFFICGIPGHCPAMRVAIEVSSTC